MSLDVPARSLVITPGAARYRNRIGLAVMLAGVFVTVMDFAAFTLTSALCGLAPGPLTLIVARLSQGAMDPRGLTRDGNLPIQE